MTPSRARKEASRRLGIALQVQYRALLEAVGNDAVQDAAIKLGDTFNTHLDFIINVLKDYGGAEVRFDPLPQPKPIPKMPEIFRAGVDVEPKRKH